MRALSATPYPDEASVRGVRLQPSVRRLQDEQQVHRGSALPVSALVGAGSVQDRADIHRRPGPYTRPLCSAQRQRFLWDTLVGVGRGSRAGLQLVGQRGDVCGRSADSVGGGGKGCRQRRRGGGGRQRGGCGGSGGGGCRGSQPKAPVTTPRSLKEGLRLS